MCCLLKVDHSQNICHVWSLSYKTGNQAIFFRPMPFFRPPFPPTIFFYPSSRCEPHLDAFLIPPRYRHDHVHPEKKKKKPSFRHSYRSFLDFLVFFWRSIVRSLSGPFFARSPSLDDPPSDDQNPDFWERRKGFTGPSFQQRARHDVIAYSLGPCHDIGLFLHDEALAPLLSSFCVLVKASIGYHGETWGKYRHCSSYLAERLDA